MKIEQAVIKVLRERQGPMHVEEIKRKIIDQGLWQPKEDHGRDYCPRQSVSKCLSEKLRTVHRNCPWKKVGPALYQLREEGRLADTRERSRTKRKTERADQDSEQRTLSPDAADEESFDPDNEEDARKWTERTIIQRRGQRRFRDSLISAYEGKCAITDCSILDILEAAHIVPYRGADADRNEMSNGLLLRADLHTLFDCKLLAIAPDTKAVLLAPRLEDSEYKKWCGRSIRLPNERKNQPSKEALRKHFKACRKDWKQSQK